MAYEIRVPALGESIVEATVAKWLKQAGEAVSAGETVVELETDKVNLEVAADAGGVMGPIVKGEGETVAIGDLLATVEAGGAAVAAPAPAPAVVSAPAPAANGASAATPVPASPVAQRIAAEQQVDLSQVTGTGPGGRVTKDDVLRIAGASAQPNIAVAPPPPPAPAPVAPAPVAPVPAARPTPPPAARPAPAPSPTLSGRSEERQRLSRRRQTIAKRLVEAQQTAAMLTTFNEVDMSAVMELRKRRKDAFKERHGVNLGFMSFFTRAVVGALKAFPAVNAEIQGDEVVYKHYYDIGVAVGVEEGLVVPVVRNADAKSFAAIEREIGELAKKAREGTLSLSELQGGTFTITNGGVYGSLMSTPILNAPQVGILGMHKIQERPVVVDGQIVVRPMMYLALSYDHRLIDGGTAVRFLVRIKELLEDPEALLLEG
jgi:2-oxoglutarate dehydrogenase E2 component (dihydrolipoamide succinyltransferase)